MRKFITLILGLSIIFSCETDKKVLNIAPNEYSLEVVALESKYSQKAFKETREITSNDGLVKMKINVASLNAEKFEQSKKINVQLIKLKEYSETAETSAPQSKIFENGPSDFERLIFEIIEVNNAVDLKNYRLEFDTKLVSPPNKSSNMKVNSWYNYELVSGTHPNGLYAGKSPFSSGNIYFVLDGKNCWVCGWNGWYANYLPIPSEWNFNFSSYWKGRVQADYDPGAVGYFTFY